MGSELESFPTISIRLRTSKVSRYKGEQIDEEGGGWGAWALSIWGVFLHYIGERQVGKGCT